MKEFKIVYMDGYDEVRDLETQDVVFSTKLPEYITKYIDRTTMDESVVDNVVNIWNSTGNAVGNLWSDGKLDEYLLDEGKCTQEEREIITGSLYKYAKV
jgi:hypothetical protein